MITSAVKYYEYLQYKTTITLMKYTNYDPKHVLLPASDVSDNDNMDQSMLPESVDIETSRRATLSQVELWFRFSLTTSMYSLWMRRQKFLVFREIDFDYFINLL